MSKSNSYSAMRLTLSAMLLALMLILGYVESMIPLNFGVPGIKLGLSNTVLVFAVYMLDIPTAYCLMALKVLLSGLLFSGVTAMAYGFAGGLFSLTLMILLHRIPSLPLPVNSALGGLAHNLGQVMMALLILRTRGLLAYFAVLALVGLACGALTGVAASATIRYLPASLRSLSKRPPSREARLAALVIALVIIGVIFFLSWDVLFPKAPEAITFTWE